MDCQISPAIQNQHGNVANGSNWDPTRELCSAEQQDPSSRDSANTELWGPAGSNYGQGSLVSPWKETVYFEVKRGNKKFLRLVCWCLSQMKRQKGQ